MSPRDATQPTLEVSRREISSAATKVERGMHAPRVRKDIGSGGIGGGSGIGSGSRILLSAWITLAGVLPAGRALAAAARAPVENARRTAAPGHTVAQRVSISRRTEDLQPMALRVTPLGSCHTSRGRLRRESTQGTEQTICTLEVGLRLRTHPWEGGRQSAGRSAQTSSLLLLRNPLGLGLN